MRVIITRPEREAASWVQALTSRGWNAIGLPLIDIAPLQLAPLQRELIQARQDIASFDAVMFVSGNAVRYFFASDAHCCAEMNPSGKTLETEGCAQRAEHGQKSRGLQSIQNIRTRAWCAGQSTARALIEAHWPAEKIDAPGKDDNAPEDSESLLSIVRPQVHAGFSALIVCGSNAGGERTGRAWLADQLAAAGAKVRFAPAYVRQIAQWSAEQANAAQAALSDGALWLLTSSEAIDNLQQIVRSRWPARQFTQARAIVTHERIAQRARQAGFGAVRLCGPSFEAVMGSIESML